MLFPDGTLIGALGTGVERTTLQDRFRTHPISQYRIDEINLKDELRAREFAEAQVGKPYDYTAILAFMTPWRTDWNDDAKWFCAELAAATAAEGGVTVARESMARVTPQFLAVNPLLRTIAPTQRPVR